MINILIVDNYDSFTYNLVQEIGKVLQIKHPNIKDVSDMITVLRNDAKELNDYISGRENIADYYSHVILSPGPGRPKDANYLEDIIKSSMGKVPILGVCLGHQAICEVMGGKITYAKEIVHGKVSEMNLTSDGAKSQLFRNLTTKEDVLTIARYHSLVADRESLGNNVKILATSVDGEIMAVSVGEKTDNPIFGVQFHPESILGNCGFEILCNFIS